MKELKDTLWKAADKLRGSMDASQYKDVVLGLVFLKYVSEAYDAATVAIAEELRAEGYREDQIEQLVGDQDDYRGRGVFVVPPTARWDYLAEHSKGLSESEPNGPKSVGRLVDDAMDLLIGANPSLRNSLPHGFNRENVDQRRLGELVDLLNNIRFFGEGASRARDLMGEVYEYFLEQFARAEGKRGGEFYTPPSVVRTIVEILEPTEGRVYDPCCGSAGMFVQAEKFLAAHDKDKTALSIFGQELNERTWRMATMNLAIHGLNGNLADRWGDTFALDLHPNLQMDYVMANPPFNIKDWARSEEDARWVYGVPPVRNANYAWMQHIISKLTPHGMAGVVMANGSMSSTSNGEGDIRANLVEADLVTCMVALPDKLFRSTGIPACLWFFAKDKSAGAQGSIDRRGEVLFIDARNLGFMAERALRDLAPEDIQRIADTYRAWRGTASAEGAEYEDVPGFCASVPVARIKEAGYALTPGRYVGAAAIADDGEPIDEKIARLTGELTAAFDESDRLQSEVRKQLRRVS
nr:class I SAM-dependent DNA methyltransferase [Mobilicoccus massiliensis]